ncbi:MAG: hypothetical protein C4334_01935 [Pyrinomonas sp.]|uniref:alpha/beta hydrolase family protein n=1 Tax=Pyrinomonas sp. TaxID=2080306 RepID=UPI00332519CD
MPPRRRKIRRFFKAFLPILLLLLAAVGALTGWSVYEATHPARRPYMVTPEQYARLSDRGLRATEENWATRDGTPARGWLLRGAEGAPAVVLVHAYGANRSWLFNLGVKLNEATNFTVLWPDLRGHGPDQSNGWTTLGAREADDVLDAIGFLRSLRTTRGTPLVGDYIGLYGVELGAYAALRAIAQDRQIRAVVLDSVPASPDDLLRAAIEKRIGVSFAPLNRLVQIGARLFLLGRYDAFASCEAARRAEGEKVLLLAGRDAPRWQRSTAELARCFPPSVEVELHDNLSLSGLNVVSAPAEQGEAYDRRVIEFFARALSD